MGYQFDSLLALVAVVYGSRGHVLQADVVADPASLMPSLTSLWHQTSVQPTWPHCPAGIKVALPCESASGRCFLQLYIESILALQEVSNAGAAGRRLPLAIMTSDDTHARTQELLRKHNNFGMEEGQVGTLC